MFCVGPSIESLHENGTLRPDLALPTTAKSSLIPPPAVTHVYAPHYGERVVFLTARIVPWGNTSMGNVSTRRPELGNVRHSVLAARDGVA